MCGGLRGNSVADQAAERFLRLAEPPEHNVWTKTRRLRDAYKRGYAKALEALEKAVSDSLKRIVSETGEGGETGPDRLAQLFPVGERGVEPREHGFRVRGRSAALGPGGRWVFSGDIERLRGSKEWRIFVALHPATEDGADPLSLVEELSATPGECKTVVKGGRGEILVPASVARVRFKGRSTAETLEVKQRRVAVRLDVGARSAVGVVSETATEEARADAAHTN
jgi:hypothetical protein